MKLSSLIKPVKITLIALACALCGFAAYARSVPAEQVYDYARHKDYTALKYLGSNMEAEDCDGNTAVCLALKKGDRNAYSLLVSYGANPHPRCERRINLPRYNPSASGSSVGMGTAGWIVTAALVVGGAGAIVALSSGGGGKTDKSDNSEQYGNCDGYKEACELGYIATGNTCRGLNGKLYVECTPAECKGFDLGYIPDNCGEWESCRTGATTLYKCKSCKEGWSGATCDDTITCPYHTTSCSLRQGYIETGNVCYEGDEKYVECKPNPCEGFDLIPPHNIDTCNHFSTCQSGDIKKYKCEACNEGWNGTTCNNENVCDYHTTECIPEQGYVETGYICYEGWRKYTQCEPRDCSDYPFYKEPTLETHCQISESCKPGEEQLKWRCAQCKLGWEGEDCSIPHECNFEFFCPYEDPNCLSDRGYVPNGAECWSGDNHYVEAVPRNCSDYPLNAIPENCASISSCRSADVTTYLCTRCDEGWEGDTCEEPATCPSWYKAKMCSETEGEVPTGRTCKSGYDKYFECMDNPCTGYTLKMCPADAAECETCLSGETTMYKVKECREGWTGIDCTVPKACEGYYTECPEGYIFPPDGKICSYGDKDYKKCEPRDCGPDYQYTECPAGYDETGETCQSGETVYQLCSLHQCPFHSLSCEEGYVPTGQTCQSGDQTYVECAISGNCAAYTLEECPVHAKSCSLCKSGETIRYKVDSCYDGWEGSDCNEPHQCAFTSLSCDGSNGEYPSGETCKSGDKTYVACTNRNCSGYTLMDRCPNDKVQTCEKCISGGKEYYKAIDCREGWEEPSDYCETPVDCNGKDYNLLHCPEHADCHHCLSGTTMWLKIITCKIDYEVNDSGTECVKKEGDEVGTTSMGYMVRSPRRIGAYYDDGVYEHTENITMKNFSNTAAIGIYADNACVTNSAKIEIQKASVQTTDEAGEVVETVSETPTGYAVGMYATSGSTIINKSEIAISGAEVAIGMYGENGTEENPTVVENAGLIEISDSGKSYGIWADGENVIVKNTGTIKIDAVERHDECIGSGCTNDSYAIVLNGGVLFQNGLMQAPTLDMSELDGIVTASADARFEIENEFEGDLVMSSEVVTDGFEDTYTVENMINAGDVSNLNLHSQSALFEAELQNESDAVLTMKSFDEVVSNQSVAEFLKQNYEAGNNEELFNLLKEKDTLVSLNAAVNALTADDVFNRFNFEDMTMMRELNADVNNKLFNNNESHLTTAGNVAPFYFESGMGSNARYALYNTRIGNKSVGLSLALSNVSSSDRHDNNRRIDETFQMSVPFGYNRYGFKFITAPRFGYAYGTYDRNGYNHTYDGTIEKRMMGLMNETRYPIDMGGWSLSPAAEFNMLGYHVKGHEENAPFALNIKSQNNYSVEAGLGLYANKNITLGTNHRLQMQAGVAAYYEFADPYTTELEMQGMRGSFKTRDERRKDNRTVLRAGFDYNFGNDFSLMGAIASFIDGTTHTNANLDFKYHF